MKDGAIWLRNTKGELGWREDNKICFWDAKCEVLLKKGNKHRELNIYNWNSEVKWRQTKLLAQVILPRDRVRLRRRPKLGLEELLIFHQLVEKKWGCETSSEGTAKKVVRKSENIDTETRDKNISKRMVSNEKCYWEAK